MSEITIGYFGIPGRTGGQTHLVEQESYKGITRYVPMCGAALHPRNEYQWCMPDWRMGEPECMRCQKIRLKWLIALNEGEKPKKRARPVPAPVRPTQHALLERVKNYLEVGGLFNPELMDHDKVRTLIMDLGKYIETH